MRRLKSAARAFALKHSEALSCLLALAFFLSVPLAALSLFGFLLALAVVGVSEGWFDWALEPAGEAALYCLRAAGDLWADLAAAYPQTVGGLVSSWGTFVAFGVLLLAVRVVLRPNLGYARFLGFGWPAIYVVLAFLSVTAASPTSGSRQASTEFDPEAVFDLEAIEAFGQPWTALGSPLAQAFGGPPEMVLSPALVGIAVNLLVLATLGALIDFSSGDADERFKNFSKNLAFSMVFTQLDVKRYMERRLKSGAGLRSSRSSETPAPENKDSQANGEKRGGQ